MIKIRSKNHLRQSEIVIKKERIIRDLKIALILTAIFLWFFGFFNFRIIFDNNMYNLWVHVPSVVGTDEDFNLDVEAWDRYERIAGGFRGNINISIEGYNLEDFNPKTSFINWEIDNTSYKFTSNTRISGIIPSYFFSGADNGKAVFNVKIKDPGVYYFVVKYLETSGTNENDILEYRSNPIIVENISNGLEANKIKRIYWGDIHAHTLYSDGSGTPDESYRYARDSALIDFAALTDHTEFTPMYGHIDLFHQFKRYQEISNSYNEPGRFVVLLAAEYTPLLTNIRHYLATGHVNLYFKGDQMPYFSSLEEDNPEMLIEHIKNSTSEEFMGWSHHQIRGAQCYDFGYFIPSVMKMEEIFSCHGSSEFIDDRNLYPIVHELPTNEHGYSINDALKMGYRFGLMASSDTHDGRLGHSLVHTDARALN
ncbi:MAG: hypothetical protein ACTSXF_15505, partial [Promethearchaeota archaeon]